MTSQVSETQGVIGVRLVSIYCNDFWLKKYASLVKIGKKTILGVVVTLFFYLCSSQNFRQIYIFFPGPIRRLGGLHQLQPGGESQALGYQPWPPEHQPGDFPQEPPEYYPGAP